MPNILITGSNSFVGRNFINLSKFRNIEEVSLLDKKPEEINFENFDIILHLAAIVHQSSKIPDSLYFKVNRDLVIQVAEHAKKSGVRQFIFLSTVKVYGEYKPGESPWNEHSKCFPEDAYGRSKFEAENSLKKLEDSNFIVTVIRTPLVYGIGVKANMFNMIKLVDRFSILPFGKINNRRSFTSVENLVALIDRVIEKKASGLFLALDEKPLSTTQLVQMIAKCLNKRIFLISIPGFFIKAGRLIVPKIFDRLYGSFEMDNSYTVKTLDFKPKVSTDEGIGKMVTAYKNSEWTI
jgi:nucleoside-diphosphate-sugar epimerase